MNTWKGKRALVTGGAGFIGSHLVDRLLAEGCARVAVVDNFFLGKETNLDDARNGPHKDALVVHREDAADADAMRDIFAREQPEVVFNLATKALLYSFRNPAGACRVNLDIALVLAELQRAGAFHKLVHLSSSEVYGTAQRTPMDEDHPLLAETTYAAGKAAADLALAAYVRMFNLDIVIARPFNNYGPRQNDGDLAAVIPLTVRRILAGTPPVVSGDGKQTRDFIFVKDTVDALLRVAALGDVRGAVFNLGSGNETAIGDLVRAIARAMSYGGPIDGAPARVADVRRHVADVRRAEGKIGRIAVTSLDEGLSSTIAWYRGAPS